MSEAADIRRGLEGVVADETAISKGQPTYLASGTDKFVLKEYYCPQCATMFEVNMVAKDEKQIPSAKFRLP